MKTYHSWKMMDKIDVAVKTSPVDNKPYGRIFDGYVVEHGDKRALTQAKDWARESEWDREKREYTKTYEPEVHTFDNGGFTVRILESADGSSQGGRLSFLACEVEKDGIKFVIGVNDALLVDLIRNSNISKGIIKEKVMFVRKAGQPGFIHEGMDAYKEAVADMKLKADMKKAKKTSKWEIGGVYSTLTQKDVCLGEVWDTMEEYTEESDGWYRRRYENKLRKRETPVKVIAWMRVYNSDEEPDNFTRILRDHIDGGWTWFEAGKPPARSKSEQLDIKESDLALIDRLLALRNDGGYGEKIKGRYVRNIKGKR